MHSEQCNFDHFISMMEQKIYTKKIVIESICCYKKKTLSNAPHKNYSKLHCSAALTLSGIEYIFDFKNMGGVDGSYLYFSIDIKKIHLRQIHVRAKTIKIPEDNS